MSYQVLARRWRPLTFDAVVGQAPVVRTLRNALAQERIAHAYLFAGPRGVGKTTTARLLAMGLNCEGGRAGGAVPCAQCESCREVAAGRALDVLEIDGASNRGIDEVRTLRENARYAPARGRRKVYIIDEVHMLTEPAFNALLKTLEEPPAHVVFVLATTEARRLPATILSRCQRFDFRPIAGAEISEALRRILEEEKVPADAVEPDALRLLARAADGSLRDALSLLDTALAYGEGRVAARTVEELLGSGGAEAAWGLAGALVRRDGRGGAPARRRCRGGRARPRAPLRGDDGGPAPGAPGRGDRDPGPGRDPGRNGAADGARHRGGRGGGGSAPAPARPPRCRHGDAQLAPPARRPRDRRGPAVPPTADRADRDGARAPRAGGGAAPRLQRSERAGGPGPVGPPRGRARAGRAPAGGGAAARRARPGARPPPTPAPAASGTGREPVAPVREAPTVARPPSVLAGATRSAAETWSAIVAEVIRVRPTLGHLLSEGVVVGEEDGPAHGRRAKRQRVRT